MKMRYNPVVHRRSGGGVSRKTARELEEVRGFGNRWIQKSFMLDLEDCEESNMNRTRWTKSETTTDSQSGGKAVRLSFRNLGI
jgi:hypothetical protein